MGLPERMGEVSPLAMQDVLEDVLVGDERRGGEERLGGARRVPRDAQAAQVLGRHVLHQDLRQHAALHLARARRLALDVFERLVVRLGRRRRLSHGPRRLRRLSGPALGGRASRAARPHRC